MTNKAHRNYFLDNLRFIAATSVVLFHFSTTNFTIENPYRAIVKYGYLGVPIFFVISGYCITLSSAADKSPINFLIRRLFRIFPPYWFSLLITLAVALGQKIFTGYNSVAVLPKTISDIFNTVILLTSPLSNTPTINWVYWSLSCEVGFYLLFFFGLLLMKKRLLYYLITLSIVSAIFKINSSPNILYLFKQWPTFMLGASIYYVTKNWKGYSSIMGYVLLIVSLILLFYRFNEEKDLPYITTAILGTIVILASNFVKSKPSVLATFGDYSYSIYLIHVPIGFYAIGYLRTTEVQKNMLYHIGFDLILYLIIIGLAYFMYKFIERPFIKMGKKVASKIDSFVKFFPRKKHDFGNHPDLQS